MRVSGLKPMQKIKKHPVIAGGILVAILALAFTFAAYKFGWSWTGFIGGESQITTTSTSHGTTTATVKPAGKTLWDLLQLLIVPLVLAIGGFWLNQIQKDRDQKAAEQRAQTEQKAAEQRAQTEREIAEDNQRETALQTYIDKMSELLLHENLRESTVDEEVRKIARIRTLTLLRRCDAERKASVLLFLHEFGLIDNDNRIIDLSEADLSEANLFEANLSRADMCYAKMSKANLSGAALSKANLSHADLSGADLFDADLNSADLTGAIGTTLEQLKRAKSLKGATLPDGSKYP